MNKDKKNNRNDSKVDSNGSRVFDENVKLADNAMLSHRKELFYEWDFEKNDKMGLDIYKVTQGSGKIAWWICLSCRSSYDMQLYRRVSDRNCPFCSRHRINHTNSLASLNPSLAKDWHPMKNGDLSPDKISSKSERNVWWLGECGHEWDTPVSNRANKEGCPICSNRRVLVGFNDMWTTNPELAKMLANPEDGFEHTQSSGKDVDWKCPECNSVTKKRRISSINSQGFFCSICSDKLSFPERFVRSLLRKYNEEFLFDSLTEWSIGKKYDFYLPKHNVIIETHGIQHYEEGFEKIGTRALKEEQANDKLKEQLAKENGIENYIVIDCRYSTVEWIKNSIEKSVLKNIIDLENVDWIEIERMSRKSIIKEACELWSKGLQIKNIASELRINPSTVRGYLKKGARLEWCDYIPIFKRDIVQLSKEKSFVASWSSIADITKNIGVNGAHISAVCRGKRGTAGGYKWMYKEDYDKMIS